MDPILPALLANIAVLLGAATVLAAIWWQGRTEDYARSWAAAALVGAAAMPLTLLPQSPFTGLTAGWALTGDMLANICFFLMADGALRYAGGRLRWRRWLAGGVLVAVISILALARDDLLLRALVNGGYAEVATIAALVGLIRHRRQGPAALMMVGSFLILAVLHALHLGDLLVNRSLSPAEMAAGIQALLLAQPFITAFLAAGGVIAACLRLVARGQAQQREAAAAARRAQAADRAKSEFLATVSHEIRTPLNAIQGCLQILETQGLTAAQARLLEVMATSSGSLLGLIDDVLDISRLEAGQMELVTGPVSLNALLREIALTLAPQADQKGLRMTLHGGEELPGRVITDGRRLRQILLNLLGNAIKFTDAGWVSLTVECGDAAGQEGGGAVIVRFIVADSGIGIPADKLDSIFRPFSQVDSSNTRKFGGAGLGLAIAQQLTCMLGGTIDVESAPGAGSRFIVTLPLEIAGSDADLSVARTRVAAADPAPTPGLSGGVNSR